MTESDQPDFWPITPLGEDNGRFYLLNARGQLRALSERDLKNGTTIYALFVGAERSGEPVEKLLHARFPPKRKRGEAAETPSDPHDQQWSRDRAADWIMRACVGRGFWSPDSQPLRGLGMWRDARPGEVGEAVVNAGRELIRRDQVDRSGVVTKGAVYLAGGGGRFGEVDAGDGYSIEAQIANFREGLRDYWGWRRRGDVDAVIGWIGVAALGAFPRWRPHLWISGRRGSGKSTLVEIIDHALGPMSHGVVNDFSAAGVRQRANRQARAHLFDEAERDAYAGKIEDVIAMFRTMSDDRGASVIRGGADHESVSFTLYGAGLLASIIPGRLEPQDRSRFVMVELDPIPPRGDPLEAQRAIETLKADAAKLGRSLWRFALDRSAAYDGWFAEMSALVQASGGEPRDGATVGAILAGAALMLEPADVSLDDDGFRASALSLAEPLIEDARTATEEGEGERCWRRLMESAVNFGGGEVRQVADILEWAIYGDPAGESASIAKARKQLNRVGLSFTRTKAYGGRGRLIITAAAHRQLDEIFRGTRWADGGHRNSLMMMAGVEEVKKPQRIGVMRSRCIKVPVEYWPQKRQTEQEEQDGACDD